MKISYEWLGDFVDIDGVAPVKRPTYPTIGGIEYTVHLRRAVCRTGSPVRQRFSGFGPKSAPSHRDFGPER